MGGNLTNILTAWKLAADVKNKELANQTYVWYGKQDTTYTLTHSLTNKDGKLNFFRYLNYLRYLNHLRYLTHLS